MSSGIPYMDAGTQTALMFAMKTIDGKRPGPGRPPKVIEAQRAIKALLMLSARESYEKVAEAIGVERHWLASVYKDRRLHDMAAQRGAGFLPPLFSFPSNLGENSPDDGAEW